MHDDRALEALITTSAEGDEASLRTLSSAISKPLFPYLRSRTTRKEDALDALQDTLVEVWKSLPRFSYRSDSAFFRFVFTIAKRKLIAIRRMRIHEDPLTDAHDVADMDTLAHAQDSIVVSRALAALSGKDRDLITLRYWSGLPFSQIAQILSMSEGAVRVRHHRALRELEGTLTPYVT